MNISGKSIIRAGKVLEDPFADKTSEEFLQAIDIASQWRFCHEVPLESAVTMLKRIVRKSDADALFAKRLKRIDSTIKKLQRSNKSNLRTMQDIGGCRCVVSNNDVLQRIVSELKKRPQFKIKGQQYRIDDYIKNPKDDGYRSYHMIGLFPDENGEERRVEVQLRTRVQHYWATAVEIIDLFTGQSLKLNQGKKEWADFFAVISSLFAIVEQIPRFERLSPADKQRRYAIRLGKDKKGSTEKVKNAQQLSKRLKVIDSLSGFSKALQVLGDHMDTKMGKDAGYALLEINTDIKELRSTIFSEKDNQNAEQKYKHLEKKYVDDPSQVVALVSTTAVGGIKEAFPNYFAHSAEFVGLLQLINSFKV